MGIPTKITFTLCIHLNTLFFVNLPHTAIKISKSICPIQNRLKKLQDAKNKDNFFHRRIKQDLKQIIILY